MLKAKSSNRNRQDLGLTVPVATRQARAIADRIMPGIMATVESRTSHDLATDTPVIITTIMFPRGHEARHLLVKTLASTLNPAGIRDADSSIVITRKVK